MRTRTCIVASCLVALLALLATAAPTTAAPNRITGKLNKPGYTLIALASNGQASMVRARRGRFTLRPSGGRVTLHLRAPDGTYAGPIVVGSERRGRRAIVGVRAGARLGRVRVRGGYARPSRRLRKKWVDAGRVARARKGVPIGAGVFGRVRSRPPRRAIPGDPDLDGIPDPLDVDDDGDLILDNFERSSAARTSQTVDNALFAAGLGLDISESVNANASTLTTADIDGALSRNGTLRIHVLPGDSVELDCGGTNQNPPRPEGLVYCSSGGTGTTTPRGSPEMPFPGPPGGAFDPDEDGFGTLDPALGGACQGCPDFFLKHGARTDQIGTSDVLTQRVTTGGVETLFPATLQFVFATVPALVSYSSEGNSGTVSYPVAANGPGTLGNGFPVADSNGDVVLTVTFWRPQRKPIPPETGDWIDIGRLRYQVGIMFPVGGPQPPPGTGGCPQDALTDPTNLTPDPHPIQGAGLRDSALDQTASAANTVTFTLNVTKCLATTGFTWDPGQELQFRFVAGNGADDAGQVVTFRRQ